MGPPLGVAGTRVRQHEPVFKYLLAQGNVMQHRNPWVDYETSLTIEPNPRPHGTPCLGGEIHSREAPPGSIPLLFPWVYPPRMAPLILGLDYAARF